MEKLIEKLLSELAVLKHQSGKNPSLVFDYDKTLASIPVDWKTARVELRAKFTGAPFELSIPDGMRVDEMEYFALTTYPDRTSEIFEFRSNLESALDGAHIPVRHVLDCLELKELKNLCSGFYIVSNNLRETVTAGLVALGIHDMFMGILCVDDTGAPKPYIVAADILKDKWGVDIKNALMLGDSEETDGVFCRRTGMRFINIEKYKE